LIAGNHFNYSYSHPDHFGSLESTRGDKLGGLMQFSPQ